MMSSVKIATEITKGFDVMNVKAASSLSAYLAGVAVSLADGSGYARPVGAVVVDAPAFPVDVVNTCHASADGCVGAATGAKAGATNGREILRNIVGFAAPLANKLDSLLRRLPLPVTNTVAEVLAIKPARKHLFGLAAIVAIYRDLVFEARVIVLIGRFALFIAEVKRMAGGSIRLIEVGLTAIGTWNSNRHLTPPIVSRIGAALFGNSALSAVMTPLKPSVIIPQGA